MSWLDLPFEVIAAHADESSPETDPVQLAVQLAALKGKTVLAKEQVDARNSIVIGADTVVEIEGELLGKPDGRDGARQMLEKLSGKTHRVVTGVWIGTEERESSFFVSTAVKFSDIDPVFLDLYVETDQPLDKAGSYGIQGMGNVFVKGIEGSYSNVVGLPLVELHSHLEQFVAPIVSTQGLSHWREVF